MANTYSQIYIQIVFAVEGRQSLIEPEQNSELQKYVSGIVNKQGHKLIAINNMPDHVHVLVGLKPSMAISDLVRAIKAGSSGFINEKKWVNGRFSWQEGFGAFSYGHSQLGDVIRYIENQQEHHRKRSFRDEYQELLDKFKVPFDERFVFKPIEDESGD
ncbi:IS200/IS605 family transposase [Haloferula sp.]|uniref:IS200/IS605 family transposase n=1 Tax=Haloferula sp. TaxID=2497595 RepID=UPI00329FEEF5